MKNNATVLQAKARKRATETDASARRSAQKHTDPEQPIARILETMRTRIATGELPPGTSLREQALAKEFGVSRDRIRDVLLVLLQRGLIEQEPNRSAVVVKLKIDRVFDLLQVREVLEGLTARLATEKMPPEHWEDLVQLFHGPMEQYVRTRDLESFLAEIDNFRRRVAAAADNPVVSEMLDGVYDRVRAIVNRTILLPGRLEQGLKELQGVLAAMRRGDATEAERLRRENIRSHADFLRRYQSLVL